MIEWLKSLIGLKLQLVVRYSSQLASLIETKQPRNVEVDLQRYLSDKPEKLTEFRDLAQAFEAQELLRMFETGELPKFSVTYLFADDLLEEGNNFLVYRRYIFLDQCSYIGYSPVKEWWPILKRIWQILEYGEVASTISVPLSMPLKLWTESGWHPIFTSVKVFEFRHWRLGW